MAKFFNTLGGKRIAFIGAGVSHKALIPMFVQAGAKVTLCDQKLLADFGDYGDDLMMIGVRLSLGESYLDGLAGQDMILRTPGFNFNHPLLQQAARDGAEITSEIELFFEHCPCRTIGVTGSDGKTTTSSLIAALYAADGRKVHLGGNIGRALLPIVDEISSSDIAVVELSSFQLISMHFSPDIAVVTNVTPNHLDHHKNMEEYVNAKRNILSYQKMDGIAVLGYENLTSRSMQKDVVGECRFFSRMREVQDGAYIADDGMLNLSTQGKPTCIVHRDYVALRGEHNLENILTAFAAVRDEVKPKSMEKVAREFKGVEHRIEHVRTLNNVEWYNDSIATSPTRVIAGLHAFDKKLIVIAGGYDKNIPFEPMAEDIINNVKILILMGQTARPIQVAVCAHPNYNDSPIIHRVKSMGEAVNLAHSLAKSGDIVTLSPASASFDMYPNFEARGKHFKELVKVLK